MKRFGIYICIYTYHIRWDETTILSPIPNKYFIDKYSPICIQYKYMYTLMPSKAIYSNTKIKSKIPMDPHDSNFTRIYKFCLYKYLSQKSCKSSYSTLFENF